MKQEQNHILENKSPHGGHTLHHNCCWYSLLTLNYGERAQCEVLPAAEAWQKKKFTGHNSLFPVKWLKERPLTDPLFLFKTPSVCLCLR